MEEEKRSENFYSIKYGVLHLDLENFKTIKCDEGFCALSAD